MMKLDPKGVEKAEAAMALANPYSDTYAKDRVTAALTAYFDHLKSEGLMREAGGSENSTGWLASSCPESVLFNDGDFDCLIIKQEE